MINQEDLANCLVTIDPEKFHNNIRKVREYLDPETKIMYVIKSMGYGHGLLEMADLALQSGLIDMLATATVEEAVSLRQNGFQGFLMILAGIPKKALPAVVQHDLVTACYNLETAQTLNQMAKDADKVLSVHLKIDSGMHRLGVAPGSELEFLLEGLKKLENLKVEGVFTHLANADEADEIVSNAQLDLFEEAIEQIKAAGLSLRWIHAAGSDAIIVSRRSHYNLVRPAALFYGYDTAEGEFNRLKLEPVLRWTSFITHTRRVKKGETAGYGGFFQAKKDSMIAIAGFGSSDGYLRSLVSKQVEKNGQVIIRGQRAPVVAICMDQTLIDVTHIEDVKTYDEVVILGKSGNQEIDVYELLKRSGTSVGNVLAAISKRPLRIYRSFN